MGLMGLVPLHLLKFYKLNSKLVHLISKGDFTLETRLVRITLLLERTQATLDDCA